MTRLPIGNKNSSRASDASDGSWSWPDWPGSLSCRVRKRRRPPQGKIAVRVEMVQLLCTVVDKKGQYITDLTQDDFIVYENNAPQKIENFAARSELPLTIAFLIDTSASVANKLKFEQEAASEFFFQVIRAQDKALLLEFDTGVTLIQDFTNEPNMLSKQLKSLRAAGGTSLYDALYLVSEEKLLWEQGERRKTLVISDGEDTVSTVTFEDALEMCQRAGATIYAISTNKRRAFRRQGQRGGRRRSRAALLRRRRQGVLPRQAGGPRAGLRGNQPGAPQPVQPQLSPVQHQARRDFPDVPGGVKNKDYVVRHRKGYFAPKE